MIITRIHIKSFGLFNDYLFIPQEGLNIIYAPNESGKTTLFDFIRYMFYGASQRKKYDGLTFREKYIPWNGSEIGGSIEFYADNRKYMITRRDGSGLAGRKCVVFDIGKGEELRCDSEPGVMFFGVSDRTFFNTCFMTDIRSISSGGDGTEIMDYVSHYGNDDGAYSKIRKSINEEYLNLSSDKRSSSEINIINKQLEQQKKRIQTLESEKNKLKNSEYTAEYLFDEILKLKKHKKDILSQYSSRKIIELKDLRSEKQKQLESMKIYASNKTEFVTASDEEKRIMNEDLTLRRFKMCLVAVFDVIMFICALIFCVTNMISAHAYLIAWMIFFLASGLLLAVVFFKLRKTLKNIKREKNIVFNKFGVKSYNDYISKYIKYESDVENIFDVQQQIDFLEKSISDIDRQLSLMYESGEASINTKENFVETNSFTNEDINVIIDKTDAQINKLQSEYNSIISYSERICELNNAIDSATEKYNYYIKKKLELKNRIAVYRTALEILDASFDELKSGVTPGLYERAYEIFSSITRGKYNSVVADSDFVTSVLTDDGYRRSSYLSRGMRDMLDFSFRIAVTEIISDREKALPYFMDDIFSSLDDQRCTLMLDTVYRLSEKHQIFFATCLGREGKYYADNLNVNTTSI